MKNEIDILRDVSEKLNVAHIPFMLTGSVAASYYAKPRMTRDIDVVVELRPEEADKISNLFGSEYYVSTEAVSEAIRQRSLFNIIHFESVIKVDFIILPATPFADQEFARRLDVDLGGFQTTIISREDLILSKLLWAKDSGSEVQLTDVRNLMTSPCDMDYLHKWADYLTVRGTLEALLKANE